MKKRHTKTLTFFMIAVMFVSLFPASGLYAKESNERTGIGIFIAAYYNEATYEHYPVSYQKEYRMECDEAISFYPKYKENASSEMVDIFADDMDVYYDDEDGNTCLADENSYTKTKLLGSNCSSMRLRFSKPGTYRLRKHGIDDTEAIAGEAVVHAEQKHIRFYTNASCEDSCLIDSNKSVAKNDLTNNTVYMLLDSGSEQSFALIDSPEKIVQEYTTLYPAAAYSGPRIYTEDNNLADYFTYEKVSGSDNLYAIHLTETAYLTNCGLQFCARGTSTDGSTRFYEGYFFAIGEYSPLSYTTEFDTDSSNNPVISEDAEWYDDFLDWYVYNERTVAICTDDDTLVPVDKLEVYDLQGNKTDDITITKKTDTIFTIFSKRTGIYQLSYLSDTGENYRIPVYITLPEASFYDDNVLSFEHFLGTEDVGHCKGSYGPGRNRTFYLMADHYYEDPMELGNTDFSAYTYDETTGEKVDIPNDSLPFTISADTTNDNPRYYALKVNENETRDFYVHVSYNLRCVGETSWWSPDELTLHLTYQSQPPATPTPPVTPTPAVTQAPAVTPTPIATPTPMVTPSPVVTPAPRATQTPAGKQTPGVPATSKSLIESKGLIYKITSQKGKKGTVTCIKSKSKKIKKATIPASIKSKGVKYKVTKINKTAFKNCKKLKKIKLPKTIQKIGKKAFTKVAKKPIFYVSKTKKKLYTKLLRKSGLKKFKIIAK